MPSGSCLCGLCKYEYTGDVSGTALCHCFDCRKMTGSAFSTNIVVPGEGFTSSGNIKTFTKKAENGNSIDSHFCPECGSTMWASGEAVGDNKIIKVGSLDSKDALEQWKPYFECYAPNKPSWITKIEGTELKKAMPDSESVE